MGITTGLSPLSQGIIIAMMFLGRVGVLSFSIAFLIRDREMCIRDTVGDDAVHQQMHSIRISDLQPALVDIESGVCGDMGGDAVHLIGGGLIDHRGGGGVEISHAPDGQRTGSHRRAVLLRVCAYRKLGLDPLLLQISGIDGHVLLPEHAVHLDSKVVTGHEGIRVVLIGELEADGDLAKMCIRDRVHPV